MARPKSTSAARAASTVIPRERVEAHAHRLGVVRRQRKVDVVGLVWSLVLSFQVGAARSIEGMRQAYEDVTGDSVARSSFYDRLTAPLARVIWALVNDALAVRTAPLRVPTGHLACFTELLALDSMVLRLHDLLQGAYRACRTNHTKAAAKLHVVMNVADGSPTQVKLTSERTNDRTPWKRVGAWLKGCLLLFDLGYFSYHLFHRIDRNGGYFLSRMKCNANPIIVATNRAWRGRSVDVVGMRLQEVLPLLQREILDVQVDVTFKKRKYRATRATSTRTFRLVAVRNDETDAYHVYLTNVPAEMLPGDEIRHTYALRWQVELLFKALSTHGHIRHMPSSSQPVVECLVGAAILAVLTSQAVYRLVRAAVDATRAMPLLRWAAIFARHAATLLRLVIRPAPRRDSQLMALLIREAPDPNVHRKGGRALPAVPTMAAA